MVAFNFVGITSPIMSPRIGVKLYETFTVAVLPCPEDRAVMHSESELQAMPSINVVMVKSATFRADAEAAT